MGRPDYDVGRTGAPRGGPLERTAGSATDRCLVAAGMADSMALQ